MTFNLTRAQAVAAVGEREWTKGTPYVARLTGLTAQPDGGRTVLRGSAHGQEKYAVTVTLGSDGVEALHCSCPVGPGCKHCAALLARAVDDPAGFTALPALDEVLDGLDEHALRRLVRRMLEREPELLGLVLSAPRRRSEGRSDLRGRIEATLNLIDYDPEEDWEGEGPDLSDLEPLLEEAAALLEGVDSLDGQGRVDLLDAFLALLSGLGDLNDEDYDLGLDAFTGPARTGVLRILGLELDENERESALDGLQESIGDFGWAPDEMQEHGQLALFAALPEEDQQVILTFIRRLRDGLNHGDQYAKQRLAATLLELGRTQPTNPVEELRLAHASGDPATVVQVLLRHGRRDEAMQALRDSRPRLAPQEVEADLRDAGLLPELEAYAAANLTTFGARAWLYGQYRQTGRNAEAYDLARDAVLKGTGEHALYTSHFLSRDLDWRAELKAVSPDWPADREAYVKAQWPHPGRAQSLMRFLLAEDMLERATALVNRTPPGKPSPVGATLTGELALRVPPEHAKPLILRAVAEHVGGRGRDHYHEAAGLLGRAAGVIGHDESRSIARLLVQDFPKLTALKDELRQAGLL